MMMKALFDKLEIIVEALLFTKSQRGCIFDEIDVGILITVCSRACLRHITNILLLLPFLARVFGVRVLFFEGLILPFFKFTLLSHLLHYGLNILLCITC